MIMATYNSVHRYRQSILCWLIYLLQIFHWPFAIPRQANEQLSRVAVTLDIFFV